MPASEARAGVEPCMAAWIDAALAAGPEGARATGAGFAAWLKAGDGVPDRPGAFEYGDERGLYFPAFVDAGSVACYAGPPDLPPDGWDEASLGEALERCGTRLPAGCTRHVGAELRREGADEWGDMMADYDNDVRAEALGRALRRFGTDADSLGSALLAVARERDEAAAPALAEACASALDARAAAPRAAASLGK